MNLHSHPTPPAHAIPVMSERRVSVIGALLVALGPISLALFTPAMPEIVRAFDTTESAVKLTLSLYFAGFAFAQLVCGPLSDGLGRKPVVSAFIGIYLAASLVALVAPSIEILIAARFMQGVGAAAGVAIARAIVRDLFTNDRSARILNLIGIILAAGPAFAPFLGGVTMQLAGWHAIFYLMVAAGLGLLLIVHFGLRETVERDMSRIRPSALLKSYGRLLFDPYFMTASLTVAGTIGAFYTQATLLPFILIDRVGLTPVEFGIGMLMQTGMFFTGSLAVRFLMGRYSATSLVLPGLIFVATGSILLALFLRIAPPSFLAVMGPIGLYAFGIAFVMPAMTTAAMAPFPHMAGAASSMTGFLQMGAGLVGGLIASAVAEPVSALSTIIPLMGFGAICCWLIFRRLPEPVLARVVPVVDSPS